MNEINVKKTKYFVIAIIILIILSIILIIHFNNKKMVRGDIDNTTTTTKSDIIPITTTTTTIKKVKVNTIKKEEVKIEEEIVEELERVENIYKSTIDEINNLVYNYKLTDEIHNNDSIISTKLNISEELKNKNIIGLYDISLYDDLLNKKSVNNSLINIKIPIKDELVGYDEYKVVYINYNNEITDEEFDVKVMDNFIQFNTNHLSVFAVIGIKNNIEVIPDIKDETVIPENKPEEIIDLSNVNILLNINNSSEDYLINLNNTLLLSKSDKLNIKVLNMNYEYNLYYSLTESSESEDNSEYKLFNENILSGIDSTNTYNFKVKIVVEDKFKEFDLGKVSVYDIVYTNDGDEQKDPIGTIYNENGSIYIPDGKDEYLYDNKDINNDIVIDNGDKIILGEDKTIEDNYINNENTSTDNVKIKVNGNIYLVEETDISNLEMTGYLIIDTSENIIFDNFDVFKNLYTIAIRSEEFTLNGIKYTYEYKDENIIIKKYNEEDIGTDENKEEITIEDFVSIFNNEFIIKNDENKELVLEKNKQVDINQEVSSSDVTSENKEDILNDEFTE